jgi:hypothetical protein
MQERPGTFFGVVLSVVLTVLIGVSPAHVQTTSTAAVDVTFPDMKGQTQLPQSSSTLPPAEMRWSTTTTARPSLIPIAGWKTYTYSCLRYPSIITPRLWSVQITAPPPAPAPPLPGAARTSSP